MKCQVCKKRDAAFYRYVAAFGKQIPVCAACFSNAAMFPKNSFAELHSSFVIDELAKTLMGFQPVYEFYSEGETAKRQGMVCSNCGFEFEEYYEKGRLGCVKCYDVFHEQLKSVIYKIHGCVHHNGSRPT